MNRISGMEIITWNHYKYTFSRNIPKRSKGIERQKTQLYSIGQTFIYHLHIVVSFILLLNAWIRMQRSSCENKRKQTKHVPWPSSLSIYTDMSQVLSFSEKYSASRTSSLICDGKTFFINKLDAICIKFGWHNTWFILLWLIFEFSMMYFFDDHLIVLRVRMNTLYTLI